MVLRIGPAGALPLRSGVRRRRRFFASEPRHAHGSRCCRGRQRARGAALRHEHSPPGDRRHHHHSAAMVVVVVSRLAVAARDGGRGGRQEEHGAEHHLQQRVRAGRHGSARLHLLFGCSFVQLPSGHFSSQSSAGRLGVVVRRGILCAVAASIVAWITCTAQVEKLICRRPE